MVVNSKLNIQAYLLMGKDSPSTHWVGAPRTDLSLVTKRKILPLVRTWTLIICCVSTYFPVWVTLTLKSEESIVLKKMKKCYYIDRLGGGMGQHNYVSKEIHGQSKELQRPTWVCVTAMTESEVFIIDFVVITQTYPLFLIECLSRCR
jgi:hypothetical protein